MQAYSLNTRVDVTAGLPWLEVCNPMSESTLHVDGGNCLEELFGIAESDPYEDSKNCSAESQNKGKTNNDTHRYIYPPHLRHHEPLAFVRKGNAAPILDKFTFKSRQLFHRPPIHYSDEELLSFIKQGLVSKQDDDIVDEVDLNIDLLHFTLDRCVDKVMCCLRCIYISYSSSIKPPTAINSKRHSTLLEMFFWNLRNFLVTGTSTGKRITLQLPQELEVSLLQKWRRSWPIQAMDFFMENRDARH